MHRVRPISGVLAITAAAGLAQAQVDVVWSNPDGGVWSDSNNWFPNEVPNNGKQLYNASLGSLKLAYTVELDIELQLENLSLVGGGVTLDLTSRQAQVNDTMTVAGSTVLRSTTSASELQVGTLALSGAVFEGAGVIRVGGGINVDRGTEGLFITGGDDLDICDTCIDHRTSNGFWTGSGNINLQQGGELGNDDGSTLLIDGTSAKTVGGDGTGAVNNRGAIVQAQTSRGTGQLITSFDGAAFFNTGSLTVSSGLFDLGGATNDLAENGILADGQWNIQNGSSLSFGKTTVRVLQAEVNISGSNSTFGSINGLEEIGESGRFSISNGKDFTAADDFLVDGTLEVGGGSFFFADEVGVLQNLDGDSIFGGTFIVEGGVSTGAEFGGIKNLGSDLTLIGPDSTFDGIGGLERVLGSGRFALQNGRNFKTQGDLFAEEGSRVVVGNQSTLYVTGELGNQDGQGVFDAGAFEIQGTFIASNFEIRELSNELILDGLDSELLDQNGEDAIQVLERIREDGILRLRNGRTLSNLGSIQVDGILSIEGSGTGFSGRGTGDGVFQSNGDISFNDGSVLELILTRTESDFGRVIANGTLTISDGATLRLIVADGAEVALGDEFLLAGAGTIDGEFGSLENIGGFEFEIFRSGDAIFGRVIPAPAAPAIIGLASLFASRRRRTS